MRPGLVRAVISAHYISAQECAPCQAAFLTLYFKEAICLARSVLITAAQYCDSLTTKGVIMFKKTIIAGLTAAAVGSGVAHAQQPPASPHTLTGNFGLFSQYIFRGLTQTNQKPALQGGFDYAHASGFYAGTWGSNISWLQDSNTYSAGSSLELDIYGGFKGSFGKSDFGYDVGLLYYWYPGDVSPTCTMSAVGSSVGCPEADTLEVYGALSWKWLSAKLSYSLNDETFGVPDSSGTYYLDLTASYPVPDTKFTLIAHYGMQKFTGNVTGSTLSNDTVYSYNDWKLGVNYSLPKDFTVGVFYTDTSGVNNLGYGSTSEGGAYPKNIAKSTVTVFVQKTF